MALPYLGNKGAQVWLLLQTLTFNPHPMYKIVRKPWTPRAARIMEYALTVQDEFITGKPIDIVRYGLYEDETLSFVTFKTDKGIEETYRNSDCLASAISDSHVIIVLTPLPFINRSFSIENL
jgi:hypothetical protein